MTTKSRKARITTIEAAAALDFEPRQDGALESPDPHLILRRLAFATMHKSKVELAKCFEDEAHTDAALAVIDDLEASSKFFMDAGRLLELARERLLIAGAGVAEAA
jgi:hypothetical protein